MGVAIVGIGCRYPGADSAREFFENILAGRRYFREIPPERWRIADYYHDNRDHEDTTYCKQAAFLEGFEFRPAEFKIPKSTYEVTDQAQWLALVTTKAALEDANLKDLPKRETAVILGNTLAGETSRAQLVRYRWPYARRVFDELLEELKVDAALRPILLNKIETRYKAAFPPVNEDNLAGGLANTIAGRVCNYFDLKGGGYTVDGACSSSLLAILEACERLTLKSCDLALAGGVDISLDPFELVGFAKVGALSDTDIRVYDQRSSGFLPGEGCGIVVLKRLEDALSNDDRIYAVIRGAGYSSDGKGGLTAPNVSGQSLAIDRAYGSTDYKFGDVELIEGHGTGTPVGDQVELTAFTEAKARHGATAIHQCGIGSVKSNIGHTKAAAGVAGFIKAALSVYYGILPPTKGIRVPHKIIEQSPHLYPLVKGRMWPGKKRRRAAVSAAGFGGINTHVTLESLSDNPHAPTDAAGLGWLLHSYQESEVFLIGADSYAELARTVRLLLDAAPKLCHAELGDLAAHCTRQFANKSYVRLGIVAASPAALSNRLERVSQLLEQNRLRSDLDYCNQREGIYFKRAVAIPRIVFLFPGQGSQRLSMGRLWRDRIPKVAKHWDYCDEILKKYIGGKITSHIFRDVYTAMDDTRNQWQADLAQTATAQPAIVATSMAATEVLRSLGIESDMSLGHSLGEYTALWNAGALTTEEALCLVAERGIAMSMSANTASSMLSIDQSAKQVQALLSDVIGCATISNYNAPDQTVVSGDARAINQLLELCVHKGINAKLLPVSNGFHSKLMAGAQKVMAQHLSKAMFAPLEHLVISTVTGDFIVKHTELPELLTQQITQPVRFIDAMHTATDEGGELFVEVGPRSVLTGLAQRNVGEERPFLFSIDLGASGEDCTGINNLLAYAYANGIPLRLDRLFSNRFFRTIQLPFQPRFIPSPCERPVPPLKLHLVDDIGNVRLADHADGQVEPTDDTPAAAGDTVQVLPSHEANGADRGNGEWTSAQILKLLQDYIVDKFGYTYDMVHPDVNVQEHLGLDSIKSVEVVAEAMARLGVSGDLSGMASLTLGQLAEHLHDLSRVRGADDDLSGGVSLEEDSTRPWVRTFDIELEEQPLIINRNAVRQLSLDGTLLLVSASVTPFLKALARCLEKKEGTTVIVQAPSAVDDKSVEIDHCIVVGDGETATDVMDEDGDALNSRLFAQPLALLVAAHQLLRVKPQNGESSSRRVFALVTLGDGCLGRGESVPPYADWLAGSGFVKSLHLENNSIDTRVIDINRSMLPSEAADAVVSELVTGRGHVEAGYPERATRVVPVLAVCPVPTLEERPLDISHEDVVLVTGGGKGITAECALELARRYRPKLALVGSSPLPDLAKSDAGSDELANNLMRFRELGTDIRYYQCDIVNPQAVQSLVERVQQELGEVTGIVHAAGLNRPQRIESLTAVELLQIVQPKMVGLINLLKVVELSQVKLLVGFSSVIARSGMPGNSDYAYANEWMNRVISRVGAIYPQMQCLSYNFSVWADVGMGARLSSVELLKSKGIDAIPVKEGVRRFADMLPKHWPHADLIVSSRLGRLPTIAYARQPQSDLRFLENIVRHQPGVELVSEVMLTPESDRYLEHHDYDGSLLFPAVLGLEAIAQVAGACIAGNKPTMLSLPSFEGLRFDRPIVVPPEGRRIRIYAHAIERVDADAERVQVEIRSSATGYKMAYFSGVCVWRTSATPLPTWSLQTPAPLSLDPRKTLYGTILFQGPMFQNLVAYLELSDKHCIAKIKVPTKNQLFALSDRSRLLLDSAQVRDAFLHAVQLCVPEFKILPVAMDKVHIRGFEGDHVFLYAQERERTGDEFLYDLDVYDANGQCVEQIHGFRCRILGDFDDEPTLKLIRSAKNRSLSRPEIPSTSQSLYSEDSAPMASE